MELKKRILEKYVSENGTCPFDEWIDAIKDKKTVAIISTRLNRIVQGNFGLCKKITGDIQEIKIDYGPGYRIYFAEDGDAIVVLLCAGDKSSQAKDIKLALMYWADYRS